MSERFYLPVEGDKEPLEIEGAEATHISKVMRLGPGDSVTVFDGQGRESLATILSANKNRVQIQLQGWTAVSRENDFQISVAVCPPRGDRLKFLVEKLTELGAHELVPLIGTRNTVIPKSNTVEKMRRYVIEASKQCRRNQLMRVSEPQTFSEIATDNTGFQHRICLHPGDHRPVQQSLSEAGSASQFARFLIGPEGGFTDEEIKTAIDAGWTLAALGPRILRTETAAIAAVATALAVT